MRNLSRSRSDVAASIPQTLPHPDDYGNYWLGGGAAIFPARGRKAPVKAAAVFIASHGGDRGFLFDGPDFRYFATAESALRGLRVSEEQAKT